MKEPKTGPVWQPTQEPCLYRHRDSGIYYSRFLVNGNRSFKTLKTTTWSRALARHARRRAEIAEQRANGAGIGQPIELRTLGDCAAKLLGQLELTSQDAKTKANYRRQLDCVRKHWPGGAFDSALPANVTFETLLRLRQALLAAEWEAPAGFAGRGGKRIGKGYSARYTNQCLARLQNVIEVAREAGLCNHAPFKSGIGIADTVWLPLPKRSKDLPTLEQMKEVFRLMGGIMKPEAPGHRTANEPNWLKWRLDRALDAQELAEFLAYTGCRVSEAVGAVAKRADGTIEVKCPGASFQDFDLNGQHGPTMRIHGTKGESSDRTIDAIPDLVNLMSRIRARREKDGLPTTGKLLRVKGCRYSLETACEKVGCMRLGHHTLRHYFATLTLSMGTPVTVVADWMGHTDKGATLLKTYAHVIRQHSAQYARNVSYSPQPSPPTARWTSV